MRADGLTPAAYAERALEVLGCDGQATVTAERSLLLRFARSAPTQATAVEDTELHLLALYEGHAGGATTNRLDDEGIRVAATRAREAAMVAAATAGRPGDQPPLPSAGTLEPPSTGFDATTSALDPAPGGEALGAAFATAAQAGLEAFGAWTTGDVETAIASSSGLRAHERVTDAYMKVICRDANGRSGWGAAASVSARGIDGAAIAAEAVARTPREEPSVLEPGDYDAVLAPDAVGGLLEMLSPLAFNGLAHAEGRGALDERIGEPVAAPIIDLTDDPAAAGTWTRAFDAEGSPKHRLALIEGGVARAVAHDTRSAARTGAVTTAHALAPGGAPQGAWPTNLVLAGGGAADLKELIAGVQHGILVTRLWYLNPVHPRRTLVTGTTRDGTFLIRDGELAGPVADVRITDEILGILTRTDALTTQQRLVSEADYYGRRFAQGSLVPALRVRGLRVTG